MLLWLRKRKEPQDLATKKHLLQWKYGVLLQTADQDQILYRLGTLVYLTGCTQVS